MLYYGKKFKIFKKYISFNNFYLNIFIESNHIKCPNYQNLKLLISLTF
jgi:hypothetical protein